MFMKKHDVTSRVKTVQKAIGKDQKRFYAKWMLKIVEKGGKSAVH